MLLTQSFVIIVEYQQEQEQQEPSWIRCSRPSPDLLPLERRGTGYGATSAPTVRQRTDEQSQLAPNVLIQRVSTRRLTRYTLGRT
jgi:hypothetical protein